MQYQSTRKAVFSVNYHVIWCLKCRRRVLGGAAEPRLKEIIGEVVSTVGGAPLEVVRRYVENQKIADARMRAKAA